MSTMTSILAQIVAGYSIPQFMIILIVACAVIGIAMIAIRQTGIQIPPWVIQILWIVLVAIVAVVAIRFLVSAV